MSVTRIENAVEDLNETTEKLTNDFDKLSGVINKDNVEYDNRCNFSRDRDLIQYVTNHSKYTSKEIESIFKVIDSYYLE